MVAAMRQFMQMRIARQTLDESLDMMCTLAEYTNWFLQPVRMHAGMTGQALQARSIGATKKKTPLRCARKLHVCGSLLATFRGNRWHANPITIMHKRRWTA
jgi:hypothetical protein